MDGCHKCPTPRACRGTMGQRDSRDRSAFVVFVEDAGVVVEAFAVGVVGGGDDGGVTVDGDALHGERLRVVAIEDVCRSFDGDVGHGPVYHGVVGVSGEHSEAFTFYVDVAHHYVFHHAAGTCVGAFEGEELLPRQHFNHVAAGAGDVFDENVFVDLPRVGAHFETQQRAVGLEAAVAQGDA